MLSRREALSRRPLHRLASRRDHPAVFLRRGPVLFRTCAPCGSTTMSRSKTSTGTSTITTSHRRRIFTTRSSCAPKRRQDGGSITRRWAAPILWSPFYAIADLSVRAMRAAGRDIAVDGYSWPYVCGRRVRVGVLRVRRNRAGDRRRPPHGRTIARCRPGLVVWAGTPLLFLLVRRAAVFARLFRVRGRAVRDSVAARCGARGRCAGMVALGLAGALMAMVGSRTSSSPSASLADFGLTLATIRAWTGQTLAGPGGAGRVRAAFAVGYLPQLLAYNALNGSPGPSPLVARKMFWYAPHALQVLADTEHGFFFWTPLAVLSIAGLILMTAAPREALSGDAGGTAPGRRGVRTTGTSDLRRIGACLLLMIALQVYISGAVESWTVAGAFGQRRFVAMTIFLVIGLAALREWIRGAVARAAVNVGDRHLRLVEPRADGGVRHVDDGPSAPRTAAQCI